MFSILTHGGDGERILLQLVEHDLEMLLKRRDRDGGVGAGVHGFGSGDCGYCGDRW